MGLEPAAREHLARFLARAAKAESAALLALERLPGGAVQENYALEVEMRGGPNPGAIALVLRTDAPSRVAVSLTRAQEFAVLRTAFAAGVAAPEPLWLCEDASVIGRPFFVMRRMPGSAAARALVRSELTEHEREALLERLGEELARLHRIRPPQESLSFLPLPEPSPALTRVALYRRYLDALPEPRPVIEWGLRWLERHAPASAELALCHSDYRTGNYLVDGNRLTGILDWEFAAWSDPLEDLGWFCARCWRFGAWEREGGGIGSREALYRGYGRVSGQAVDRAAVSYWELMAAVRWGVIALQQGQRHLSGEQSSLELALTGRMVAEMELDILQQLETLERGARACA